MLTKLSQFTLGLFLAASLAVTAGCGGSSSGSGDGSGGGDTVPVGGNNVEGPSDPVQDVLTDIGEGTGDAPVVGDSAEALVNALVALLDAPDGLAGGFQDFLSSQDPADLIGGGGTAGDAILSFAAGLEEALIQLNEEGQQVPGLDSVLADLQQIQEQIQTATTGETEGGDLTVVTDALVSLSESLGPLSEQVPSEVADQQLVSALLTALSDGANDLSTILDGTGQLDGSGTSTALVGAFDNLVTNLAGSLPGNAGSQLQSQVDMVTGTFESGLGVLLEPLFQSLSAALVPVTGEGSPLADAVPGFLGSGGNLDQISQGDVGEQLQGLPVLGDLLAGLAGDADGGGIPALEDALSSGGDIPLIGDLLQSLPGLTGSGGQTPSPAVLGDLLASLLAPSGDSTLPIQSLLDQVTQGGGFDSSLLTDLLDGLLGNLLGMAGGTDPSGGFLDNLSPGDGENALGSLIDSLLGGLLGSL